MSAFPSAPSDGDEFTLGNRTFSYNATLGGWRVARTASTGSIVQSSGGAQVVSSTADFDKNPPIGKLVYSTADEALFVFDGSEYADPVTKTRVSTGNWTVDVTQATVVQSTSIGGTTPSGLYFKEDGTKLFVYFWSGFGYSYGDVVAGYTLSTPWDISTITYDGYVGFGLQDNPGDIYITPDGLTMYIMQTDNSAGHTYKTTFGTAWDISTLSASATYLGRNWGHQTPAMYISPDGNKMYWAGHNSGSSHYVEHNLSTPYDIATRTQVNILASSLPLDGIFINPTGTRLYGRNQNYIEQHDLTTPFDISTATNKATLSVATETQGGLFISTFGEYMYDLRGSGSLVQYGFE